MACVISCFYRVASCVFLCAVVLYAPGFAPVFMLPKWAWHDRSDGGLARRRPSFDVICPRRLAQADSVKVRYGGQRRNSDRFDTASCRLASDSRA